MSTRLKRFERAATETTATTSRATPETFAETLSDVLVEPAVGAPLPFDEVSLTESAVKLNPTREQLYTATTGVTGAILGIASYGSLVLRSTQDVDELASLFPEYHVVIVREQDVVDDMEAAFSTLEPLFAAENADAIIATGPSATADMGSLIYGAHGPSEVHVIIVEGS